MKFIKLTDMQKLENSKGATSFDFFDVYVNGENIEFMQQFTNSTFVRLNSGKTLIVKENALEILVMID
jgi:uncharacterized protein YlzI (FlbEa/FlbD family)